MPAKKGYAARGSRMARKGGVGKRVRGTPGFTRNVGIYGRLTGKPSTELKFLDFAVVQSAVLAAGDIEPSLNIVIQNDKETGRIGRKIFIKRVQLKGHIELATETDAAVVAKSDRLRIIMYLDKQANGAPAIPDDILQTTDINSWRDMEHVNRFRILYDKTHVLNRLTVQSKTGPVFDSSNVLKNFSMGKNTSLEIIYNGTTGAMGTIQSNNIGILFISENAKISFKGISRIRYTD